MEGKEKGRRKQKSIEMQRREYEKREREEEKKKRQRTVRRQLLLIVGAGILIVFAIWGGTIGYRHWKEADAVRQEQTAEAEAKAAKEVEIEKYREERRQEEKEMEETMDTLQSTLADMIPDYNGSWSVYVKELEFENEFSLNNQTMYPASLIKLFVMAATFENMDQILEYETEYLGREEGVRSTVAQLLENMIEVSDNESYNELVRLQSSTRDFAEGCNIINAYLQEEGYTDTGVHTTLHPSSSSTANDGLGDNGTCVEDCGMLLEKIYKGTCGSQEDSGEMLHLLLNQENTLKIPGGLPAGIEVAHKTGETSEVQDDVGIIYGEETDFILCIMIDQVTSEADIYSQIHELTETVYQALNET